MLKNENKFFLDNIENLENKHFYDIIWLFASESPSACQNTSNLMGCQSRGFAICLFQQIAPTSTF
jgi:hypothetical protein